MVRSISAAAKIGSGAVLGHGCIIGAGAALGVGCQIGNHVVIHERVELGEGVRVEDHATVGRPPWRRLGASLEGVNSAAPARIGDGCMIGTGAVIYAGAVLGRGVTVEDLAVIAERAVVGEDSRIGRGAAIDRDCRVGRECTVATHAHLRPGSVLSDGASIAFAAVGPEPDWVPNGASGSANHASVGARDERNEGTPAGDPVALELARTAAARRASSEPANDTTEMAG